MWSYAKLSQTAAAKGGPDPFVRELVTRGIKMGEKRARRKYGPLYVGLGLLGGFAIDRLIDFAIDRFTRGNDEEAVVNSAAAQMLIDSINQYEAEAKNNPDIEPLPELSREEADERIRQLAQQVADELP